jgi:hypothetical protein
MFSVLASDHDGVIRKTSPLALLEALCAPLDPILSVRHSLPVCAAAKRYGCIIRDRVDQRQSVFAQETRTFGGNRPLIFSLLPKLTLCRICKRSVKKTPQYITRTGGEDCFGTYPRLL